MIKALLFFLLLCLCVMTVLSIPTIIHNIGYYNMRPVRQVTYDAHSNEKYAKSLLSENLNIPFSVIEGDLKDVNDKKVFCFSLYGKREEYKAGAERLIADIGKHFPSWVSALFISHDCPWIEHFKTMRYTNDKLLLFIVKDNIIEGSATGMFWRFIPLALSPDRMFVLDVDDQLDHAMLKNAFLKWKDCSHTFIRILQSNPSPWPKEHIHCASWGMKGLKQPLFKLSDITDVSNRQPYGIDEIWLSYNLRHHISQLGILTGYPSMKSKFIYNNSYGKVWKNEELVCTPFRVNKDPKDVTPDSYWKTHV